MTVSKVLLMVRVIYHTKAPFYSYSRLLLLSLARANVSRNKWFSLKAVYVLLKGLHWNESLKNVRVLRYGLFKDTTLIPPDLQVLVKNRTVVSFTLDRAMALIVLGY